MKSTQKVTSTIDNAEHMLEDPDLAPTARAVIATLTLIRGNLEGMLPSDPEELDDLLAKGAGWLLGLRSDDAEPAELAA